MKFNLISRPYKKKLPVGFETISRKKCTGSKLKKWSGSAIRVETESFQLTSGWGTRIVFAHPPTLFPTVNSLKEKLFFIFKRTFFSLGISVLFFITSTYSIKVESREQVSMRIRIQLFTSMRIWIRNLGAKPPMRIWSDFAATKS
jgi:hypothetical protein